jgi:putative AlgH/UPF0301 family transcriptional regulator
LLSDQEFQKSIIRVIQDDHNLSGGIMLNDPTSRTVDEQLASGDGFFLPTAYANNALRYGGNIDCAGEEKPLFRFRASENLKISEPVGSSSGNVCRFTMEEIAEAIARLLGTPQDFKVMRGSTVWEKKDAGRGGIRSESKSGDFEIVLESQTQRVWDLLAFQADTISSSNHKLR